MTPWLRSADSTPASGFLNGTAQRAGTRPHGTRAVYFHGGLSHTKKQPVFYTNGSQQRCMGKGSPLPAYIRSCPACSSPVEPGHILCPVCGTTIPPLPSCRKCGAFFIAPVKFCELCGTPVDARIFSAPEGDGACTAGEEPGIPVARPANTVPGPEPAMEGPEPAEGEDWPGDDDSDAEETIDTADETRPTTVSPQPARAGRGEDLPPDPLMPPSAEDMPRPAARKPKTKALLLIGGIVILLIILATVFTFVLPVPAGSDTRVSPPARPVPEVTPLPSPEPAVTESVTAVQQTTLPAMPVFSLDPLPVEQFPKGQDIIFQVDKDPITSRITVICAGGPGINSISTANVKVTREDGTILDGVIRPSTGAMEVSLEGSEDADRVEVIAKMYSGQAIRAYDQVLSYKER